MIKPRFKFCIEKAGVISEKRLFIVFDRKTGCMYEDESLFKLIVKIFKEFNQDKHLIG